MFGLAGISNVAVHRLGFFMCFVAVEAAVHDHSIHVGCLPQLWGAASLLTALVWRKLQGMLSSSTFFWKSVTRSKSNSQNPSSLFGVAARTPMWQATVQRNPGAPDGPTVALIERRSDPKLAIFIDLAQRLADRGWFNLHACIGLQNAPKPCLGCLMRAILLQLA